MAELWLWECPVPSALTVDVHDRATHTRARVYGFKENANILGEVGHLMVRYQKYRGSEGRLAKDALHGAICY